MKRRSTKSALLMSAISLLLCVSMLIGSTFAWFTDSVTSANNIIKSGNLDVELYYQVEGQSNWTKVTAATNVFMENALWEPGHTEVVKLKVVNEGNLALKYTLGVNVASETGAVNVEGNPFLLSDYIKFGIVPGTENYTREQAVAAVDATATALKTAYNSNVTKLLPKADSTTAEDVYSDIVTMVVYMPTSVGNEANYRGETAPQINLGINLFATQEMYEEDSFDEKYDNVELVGTAASLQDALTAGKNVVLNADIDLGDTTIAVPSGYTGVIDLNGKTVSMVSADADKNDDGQFSSADNTALFTVKGNLTVCGEGTVSAAHTGDNMGWSALFACFSVEGGELTLGEGVVVTNAGGTDMSYAVDVNTTLGNSVLNVDGAILYSPYVGVRVFNNNNTEKGIVNYNSGIISGESRDIWTQIMSAPAENAVVNIAGDIAYTTNANGDRYYFETDAVAVDAASMQTALSAGGVVHLLGDVDLGAEQITVPSGVAAELNLNGHDIAYTTGAAEETYHAIVVNGNLTISGNGTIELVDNSGAAFNAGIQSTAISVAGGTLTLNEGVKVNSQAGAEMAYAVDVNTTLGNSVLNVNGAELNSSYIGVRIFNNNKSATGTVNFNSGIINGEKKGYDIWAQNMSNPAANAIVNIAADIPYTTANLSGVMYYIG